MDTMLAVRTCGTVRFTGLKADTRGVLLWAAGGICVLGGCEDSSSSGDHVETAGRNVVLVPL
jgi:hypothetical protein